MAIVMLVAIPAALAAYTGVYTPTQSVTAHQLSTPASFTCTAPGNSSVSLAWTDSDATTPDVYGTFVISGYAIERSINGGAWSQISTPSLASTTSSDSSFGLLHLNDQISYRMRSTKSTNWVSAYTSNTVTATITSLLIFTHVTCP
jgi:hypothetical protein